MQKKPDAITFEALSTFIERADLLIGSCTLYMISPRRTIEGFNLLTHCETDEQNVTPSSRTDYVRSDVIDNAMPT